MEGFTALLIFYIMPGGIRMLTLDIPDRGEMFDVENQVFLPTVEGGRYSFEHSLKSMTIWEEKYQIPFLHSNLTNEQTLDYILMMCLEPINPMLISKEVIDLIVQYMKYTPTATKISQSSEGGGKTVTAEVIYAWMAGANVPFECDSWNLKKLLTLLNVISAQSSKPKKMPYEEKIAMFKNLNEQRKAEMNTKG